MQLLPIQTLGGKQELRNNAQLDAKAGLKFQPSKTSDNWRDFYRLAERDSAM